MRIIFLSTPFLFGVLRSSLVSASLFDDTESHPSSNSNGSPRRVGKLAKVSRGAYSADCSADIDIQLFSESSSLKFKPENNGRGACKPGKAFVGSTADGKVRINLVPGQNDSFAASVNDLETGTVSSIGVDANGDMFVEERSQDDYPPEADPEDDMPAGERELLEASFGQPSSAAGLRGGSGNDRSLQAITVIDVLSPWTANAECRNAGQSRGCTVSPSTELAMRNRIDLAISETNQAYADSGVDAELRLAHAYRETYVETSSNAFSNALSQARSSSAVAAKRTEFGADVVARIIDDSQYCGIAYLGPSIGNMFSVTAWNCATGYYSFGHEIGHNMGCNHDKGTTNACSSSNYNYGYRDPGANYRSILAYNCKSGQCDNNAGSSCTRVQFFSNPNNLWQGQFSMGNADTDNARRINDVKVQVAAYYASANPMPTQSPELPTPPPTKMPTRTPTPPPTRSPEPPTPPPTGIPHLRPHRSLQVLQSLVLQLDRVAPLMVTVEIVAVENARVKMERRLASN